MKFFEAVEGCACRAHNDHVARLGLRLRLAHRGLQISHLEDRRMLALDGEHAVADLGRGRAGQDERLDMRADRLAQHVVGDVLVISARDQDDLLLEGFQTGNGARRAGGDRIVVVLDAVEFADKLDAVLHAAERRGDRADVVIRRIALHHGRGHHHVVDVVRARDADVSGGHELTPRAVLCDIDDAILEKHAVGQFLRLAGAEQVACGVQRARDLVVQIEHQTVALLLAAVDRGLGLHIFVKVLVVVQMVGRQVGDRRHMGRMLHAHQLEGGQLDDGQILGLHLAHAGQQRRADVAAQMHGIARVLEDLADERGRGGLAVRAGDADDRAGADREKQLHLAGDLRAVLLRLFQKARMHAGRAEDHVLVERIQIMLTQHEVDAQRCQRGIAVAQFGGILFVMYGDPDAGRAQHADERHIAHPCADDADPLIRKAAEILFQCCHKCVHRLFLA